MKELVDKYCHIYYVYITTNNINGKRYVGQRHTTNEWFDDPYLGSGIILKRAIAKYGIENFSKIIIEYCTKETLDAREIYWIEKFNCRNPNVGYNILVGGNGVGSGEDHPNWHKIVPQEVRDKISEKLKGIVQTEEHKRKNSEANTGRINSVEAIRKISVTLTGKYKKEEHPNFGSKREEITGKRIAEALSNKPIITCEFCGYASNNTGNMTQHHGDKCKQNPDYVPEILTCPHCGTTGTGKSNMVRYHFENCKDKII